MYQKHYGTKTNTMIATSILETVVNMIKRD